MRRLVLLVSCVIVLAGCADRGSAPRPAPEPTAVRTGLDTSSSMPAAEQERYLDVVTALRDRARAQDCAGAWALGGAEVRGSFPGREQFCAEVLPAAAEIDLADASYVEVGRDGRVRVTLGARRGATSTFGFVFLADEDGRRVVQSVGLTPPS